MLELFLLLQTHYGELILARGSAISSHLVQISSCALPEREVILLNHNRPLIPLSRLAMLVLLRPKGSIQSTTATRDAMPQPSSLVQDGLVGIVAVFHVAYHTHASFVRRKRS